MNRVAHLALCLLWIALIFCFAVNPTQAQNAPAAAPPSDQAKPANPPADKDAEKKEPAAQENPFAPEPAPPLPAGMTGSDANDPRFKLGPGLYDAGESAMGLEHLLLVKKPDAFQLGSTDADDSKVKKTLGQLGLPEAMLSKMPKPFQLVIAQLAFANSDLAFEGNHLFQGNFYGVNIFDITDPAKAKLLTTMVCPGGQGDVSVYKNLLFMSVEMPNGRLDCGAEGFPPEPPPTDEAKDKDKDSADKKADADNAKDADKEKEKTTAATPPSRSAEGSLPRRENLRHFRHQQSQAGGRRANLPRIPHPHPRRRS